MAAWGPYVWEWGSILLRWLHVTAAIAWIGASFFFMHLDAGLRKMPGMKTGVAGVSWQVHAGGFYEMSKYTLAPAELPDHLDLAQVAVLLDLDLRLQPAVLGLLRPIERLPHRSDGHAAQPDPGGGDRRRVAGARLDRLRSAVQVAARQERRAAGAGRLRLRRADELRLHARLLRSRRADPHRRADGDDDDRQRLPGHHAQHAQVGGGADRRARARAAMGEELQAAFDPQQLHHAARPVHDAVQPLSGDLRQSRRDPGDRHLRGHRRRARALLLQSLARRRGRRQGAVVGVAGGGRGDLGGVLGRDGVVARHAA